MYNNNVEYILEADYALFSNPVYAVGGEKCSYMVPTYEALKRITCNIYWKPTIIWVIDEVKILNQIDYECKAIKKRKYNENICDLSYFTYLKNVKYLVKAHFIWNYNYPFFSDDRNIKKHKEIFERALQCGGRFPIYAGVSECPAYVREVKPEDLKSIYDNVNLLPIGYMYHSKGYPNENLNGENKLYVYFQNIEMKNGIIKFKTQNECDKKYIKEYQFKQFEDRRIV